MDHADVRRMLTTMKAETAAARAIALANAVAIYMAHATGEADWAARAAFLTPITKAFGTETGANVSDLGIQVHGGMGYSRAMPFEHIYRHHRRYRITEGTEEVQMRRVAQYLFGFSGKSAS